MDNDDNNNNLSHIDAFSDDFCDVIEEMKSLVVNDDIKPKRKQVRFADTLKQID